MTFEEHVAIAMPLEAAGHPAQRVGLAALDVDLDEVDAIDAARVEQRIETGGLALEVRGFSAACAVRDSPQLPACSVKPTKPRAPESAPAASRKHFNLRESVRRGVLREQGRQLRMRLEREHASARPDEVRADQREVAPVGAHVDRRHARPQQPHRELRFLRLVAAGEADLARDRVLQIADERRAAEISRQPRQERLAREPREHIRQLIPAERQRANRRRRERHPERRRRARRMIRNQMKVCAHGITAEATSTMIAIVNRCACGTECTSSALERARELRQNDLRCDAARRRAPDRSRRAATKRWSSARARRSASASAAMSPAARAGRTYPTRSPARRRCVGVTTGTPESSASANTMPNASGDSFTWQNTSAARMSAAHRGARRGTRRACRGRAARPRAAQLLQ